MTATSCATHNELRLHWMDGWIMMIAISTIIMILNFKCVFRNIMIVIAISIFIMNLHLICAVPKTLICFFCHDHEERDRDRDLNHHNELPCQMCNDGNTVFMF